MGQPSLSTEVCVNTQPSLHSRVRARCPSILLVLPSVFGGHDGDLDAIHQHIHVWNGLLETMGRTSCLARSISCLSRRAISVPMLSAARSMALAGTSRPAKPASVRGPARTASRRPASPPCALHRVKTPSRQYPVRHRQDAVLWSNVNTGSRVFFLRIRRPPKERTWPAFP